jgi:aminoglycoside phosphotransferase (APT) family kinase protein
MDSYLGTVDRHDPLYDILLEQACPDVRDACFHVNRMASGGVYRYVEEKSRTAIIGKFFRLDDHRAERVERIQGEYDKLVAIRSYGFSTSPNFIVRPIAREPRIGLALIEDYVEGRDLDHYIIKAIHNGDRAGLRDRLTRLAAFFYYLHSRTGNGLSVDLEPVSAYYRKLLDTLELQTLIASGDRQQLLGLLDRWLNRSRFQGLRSSIVHGDATPTNFLFTSHGDVVAIDLERMKQSDVVYDIGMVCGELKHAFLWRTGNPYASEPFIRHFLKSYAAPFSDPKRAFREITGRNPFFMAMTELRIARNSYLDWNYRKRLVHEAFECLRWGLKPA